AEFFDEPEDVIPAATIQPRRMFAQLVKNLLGLERDEDRLDQNRRANRTARNLQRVLREIENVVPEPCFEMALHLRQIKIRAAAALQQFGGVVEKIQTEIEQAAGNRFAIHKDVLLRQMPAARADEQRRGLCVELVLLAVRVAERNCAAHGVAQIRLA